MDILPTVAEFIRRHALLRPGERVVAAVSGGPDSLCLLDCLVRLGYRVTVAHLDHQLRPESRGDAEYTLAVAQQYGLAAVVAREDVRQWASRGLSLEEAARQVRYRFLVRAAREHRAAAVATGHTADDQAETVLMHFLRGAGPEGLRGMLPCTPVDAWTDLPGARGLRLIRPLLPITREQTIAHCAAVGLEPREDLSNLDRTFYRNRLRHSLLPSLEAYNPAIRPALLRTARLMAAQADLSDGLTDKAWPTLARAAGKRVLALNVAYFLSQPEAVQLASIRRAVRSLRPALRDLSLETTERVQRWIASPPPSGRATIAGALELWHLGGEVLLALPCETPALPQFPQVTSGRKRRIPIPGTLRLAHGWRLEATLERSLDRRGLGKYSERQAVAFDAEALPGDVGLRSPRRGERLHPLGMSGSTKLSDLFVNQHIPRLARARWPIVVGGETPVWVVGLRRSRDAPVRPRTRRALVLRLIAPAEV